MFDFIIPKEVIDCIKCGEPLTAHWQTKDWKGRLDLVYVGKLAPWSHYRPLYAYNWCFGCKKLIGRYVKRSSKTGLLIFLKGFTVQEV